jgi:membrane fusion protein (multidrug efflux system)
MPNNNGTQTIDADEKQSVTVLDLEGPVSQSEQRLSKHPVSRRMKVLMIAAAIVIAIAAIYFLWDAFRYEDTDDAQVDGDVLPLSPRINGQIKDVRVVEGQYVHAGEVLVTIDPRDYQLTKDLAQANLADALLTAASSHWNLAIAYSTVRSYLDSAKTAVINAEDALKADQQSYASAEAALVRAEANAARSDADLERYIPLFAKEDFSHQQYDQAVATATANRAAVVSAQAGVYAAEQFVQQAQGKLLQARNDLHIAETAPEQISLIRNNAQTADDHVLQQKIYLAQAELNLNSTVICSPVTGIVGKKNVETGQHVSIGQELVAVVPLDDVWVTANFRQTQLAHMRPGQPVEIKVDAYSHKWKGHVTNLGGGTGSMLRLSAPENASGKYLKVADRVPVRIDFDRAAGQEFNAQGLLKPGLSVESNVRVR